MNDRTATAFGGTGFLGRRVVRHLRKHGFSVQIASRHPDRGHRPEEAKNPTTHGLRGTGILTRYARGYDVDQIANDVGMSRQMVEHYMRFRDQMEVAAQGRARLKVVK